MSMTSGEDIKSDSSSLPMVSLLDYAVKGSEESVLAILENASIPDLEMLLSHKGVVTDYSGRVIEGTVFQIALGAEDVEMCDMIVLFFDKIPNGRALKLRQFNEQIGSMNVSSPTVSRDIEALQKVASAISLSQTDAECVAALDEFRDYLKPKSIIISGRHFDVSILVEALKIYHLNYVDFGDWDSRKNRLFWTNVVGYIQRYLPACYAQAFCQGLVDVVVSKSFLQRGFNFRHAEGFLFPLDSTPKFRLGYDYAGGQWGLWDAKASGERAIATADSLKSYIEQKRQRIHNLGES